VANIYDVSGRLYLIKLSKANRKEHLLIESGIRIHTTNYVKNQKDLPSGFSMKLRKHLRTKKLSSIEQLGVDRVIDLTFGKGEACYHILVELYASGNVILTDHEYTILSLLRSHKFEDDANISVKSKYPFSHAAGMTIDSITTDPKGVRALMQPPAEEVTDQPKAGKKKNKE
jgi:predicted ribosome quality control (RQC) complex YloA/Tae2 family protein